MGETVFRCKPWVSVENDVKPTECSNSIWAIRVKIFAGMGIFLAAAEVQAKKTFPGKPDMFARSPFIIIIRQEPKKGQVRAALKKIFPPSNTKR